MSTYAIIKTGGKQVKVEVGQAVYVEKLNVEAGQEVTFNEVVLVGGENTVVGTPLVSGATVVGTVEKQGEQKKVVTYKYKPKKGSHRKQGHRQRPRYLAISAIRWPSSLSLSGVVRMPSWPSTGWKSRWSITVSRC